MKTEHQEVIKKHIQKLGFDDIYAFALEQLIVSNQRQLEESKAIIKSLEEKYEMDYEAFDKGFHSIEQIEVFEKEDDGMDWQMEMKLLKATEEELATLTTLKENDDEGNI